MDCHLCHFSPTVRFLDLGKQPLANKYPRETEFAREDFFPLSVYFCPECRNVELGTIISRERMFLDYYYLSSVNPGLVRHFERLAEDLKNSRFVVDIGSNDGILLKPLKTLGVRAVGVDPSENVGKMANDAGLETLVSFFDRKTAETIHREYGPPDVVVASSIFTHVEDPHEFIEALNILMDDEGRFILEVEYIGNILRDIQFERFYLDRPFYYSLTSLVHLFGSHSMKVIDVIPIEPHGGSLRVIIEKNASPTVPSKKVAELLNEERTALTPERLTVFAQTVNGSLAAFREKLEEYKRTGVRVAGYSAPARVSTICNAGHIGPDLIPYIVDDSPLKQGRHSPGTHIPIVPREFLDTHPADLLVVFAYEYLDDIQKKTNNKYRYLIPIPPREVRPQG